jgi:predicted nuclease of predicted toxin-antitoxin system
VSARIVEILCEQGHDILWIKDIHPGEGDEAVLERSRAEHRILLTEDWDFGDLVVRSRKPALGVVIVGMRGTPDEIARRVAVEIAEIGQNLVGRLTIMESGRARQRGLVDPDED